MEHFVIIVNGLQLLADIGGVLETGVYFLLPALYRNLDDFFFPIFYLLQLLLESIQVLAG